MKWIRKETIVAHFMVLSRILLAENIKHSKIMLNISDLPTKILTYSLVLSNELGPSNPRAIGFTMLMQSWHKRVTLEVLNFLQPLSSPGLLGCDALWWCDRIQTFRRIMLPPSSGLNFCIKAMCVSGINLEAMQISVFLFIKNSGRRPVLGQILSYDVTPILWSAILWEWKI